MGKKEIVISFLNLVSSGEIDKGYTRHVSLNFIHHNQHFQGSRASLMQAMQADHEANPNLSIEIHKLIEENDTVVSHSLVTKADMQIVVAHIFKFEQDKIIELWDIGQVLIDNSPNENGIF